MVRSLFEWVDVMPMSIAWRESLNGYPLLLTAHVVSMGLVAGVIIFWDMRLAGMALKRVPVSKIQATMFPWMTLGLVINAGTGEVQGERPYSWIKITLVVLTAAAAVGTAAFLFSQ